MQTFLPYQDFKTTAKCLDRLRLGKQRVETLQLLQAIKRNNGGWINHPACKMWRGYEGALALYGIAICDEWISRGYRDTCKDKILNLQTTDNMYPGWLFNTNICSSHRAALLYKNFEHYSKYNWLEEPKIDYIWPV